MPDTTRRPSRSGTPDGRGAFETRHGWRMTTHGMMRVLVILMEVEYTGGTDPMPGGSLVGEVSSLGGPSPP